MFIIMLEMRVLRWFKSKYCLDLVIRHQADIICDVQEMSDSQVLKLWCH